jgi:hypothetical protein
LAGASGDQGRTGWPTVTDGSKVVCVAGGHYRRGLMVLCLSARLLLQQGASKVSYPPITLDLGTQVYSKMVYSVITTTSIHQFLGYMFRF